MKPTKSCFFCGWDSVYCSKTHVRFVSDICVAHGCRGGGGGCFFFFLNSTTMVDRANKPSPVLYLRWRHTTWWDNSIFFIKNNQYEKKIGSWFNSKKVKGFLCVCILLLLCLILHLILKLSAFLFPNCPIIFVLFWFQNYSPINLAEGAHQKHALSIFLWLSGMYFLVNF